MLGVSESGFELTVKVNDSPALERYNKGKMEFGPMSGMFIIMSTIVLFFRKDSGSLPLFVTLISLLLCVIALPTRYLN